MDTDTNTNTMSSYTKTIQNYSVVLSLNERTIYLKLTDQVNFTMYESNLDNKELRLAIELNDAFHMMRNCFDETEGHKVVISVSAGIMRVAFAALVGGYMKMNFDVLLKEKIMSNDGQLTTTINRLEQKQQANMDDMAKKYKELEKKIKKLDEIIDAVSNAHIPFNDTPTDARPGMFVSINTTEFVFDWSRHMDTGRIKFLYKLEKLSFENYTVGAFDTWSNANLRELIIRRASSMSSFSGLCTNLPNLESLRIENASSLPSIVPYLLTQKHKIKKMVFVACTQITASQMDLQTYCRERKIELAIS
jgi:hypothetical protein